jgi:hypothetical protein
MNSKNKKEISEKYKRLGLRSSSSSMEKREETPENYPKWKMREDRHSPEKIEQIKRIRRRKSSSPTMKIRENKNGEIGSFRSTHQFIPIFLRRKSSSPTMKMTEDKTPRRTRRSRSSSPKRKKRESPRRTPSPPNLLENKMFEQEDELAQDIKRFEKYNKTHRYYSNPHYSGTQFIDIYTKPVTQLTPREKLIIESGLRRGRKLMTRERLGEIKNYVDYEIQKLQGKIYKKGYYTEKEKEDMFNFLKLYSKSFNQYVDDHFIIFSIDHKLSGHWNGDYYGANSILSNEITDFNGRTYPTLEKGLHIFLSKFGTTRPPSPPNSTENKMFEEEDKLARGIRSFEKKENKMFEEEDKLSQSIRNFERQSKFKILNETEFNKLNFDNKRKYYFEYMKLLTHIGISF